jgi:predicted aspartyl protease
VGTHLDLSETGGLNAAMGMFKVRVRVANPSDASRFFEDEFWVDTGALYSFAPEERLQSIGIDPALSRDVILADGRRERLHFGEARMTVEGLGETLTCPVIFGPPGSLLLLGATALETFGVDADPVGKRLKPVAAVIGGFLASR